MVEEREVFRKAPHHVRHNLEVLLNYHVNSFALAKKCIAFAYLSMVLHSMLILHSTVPHAMVM